MLHCTNDVECFYRPPLPTTIALNCSILNTIARSLLPSYSGGFHNLDAIHANVDSIDSIVTPVTVDRHTGFENNNTNPVTTMPMPLTNDYAMPIASMMNTTSLLFVIALSTLDPIAIRCIECRASKIRVVTNAVTIVDRNHFMTAAPHSASLIVTTTAMIGALMEEGTAMLHVDVAANRDFSKIYKFTIYKFTK